MSPHPASPGLVAAHQPTRSRDHASTQTTEPQQVRAAEGSEVYTPIRYTSSTRSVALFPSGSSSTARIEALRLCTVSTSETTEVDGFEPNHSRSGEARSRARGTGRIRTDYRLSKGQVDLLERSLVQATECVSTPHPRAMRAMLIHLVHCHTVYRHRYEDDGVPIPWNAIADLEDGVAKTREVWAPLEAVGFVEARPFRSGTCRRFILDTEVLLAFADARGTSSTRYDAMTGQRTRARYRTDLTYDGVHSWKGRSTLMYDVLRYWRGARCLANHTAAEAYLTRARAAVCRAENEADEAGRSLRRIDRDVRQSEPYGPLTAAAHGPIGAAKAAYRQARRLAAKAAARYAQDAHCWGVACDQVTTSTTGFPLDIVPFQPAYEVQSLSGRLTFRGGGPQNLSREAKAAMYSGIPGLINYDIVGSQTSKLVEEFEDAIRAGADLDISVLTEYPGKDALAESHGVPRDVFKRAEHAPKFGAGFPHATFSAAWNHARALARKTLDDHGPGHGESRYMTWEERVARELPTMARVAYEVASDPRVPDLVDPEAVYTLLKDVFGPMAREIKRWRVWLVEHHWALYSSPGGDGRFVEGPCGFPFYLHHYDESERGKKYATNRLQGGEAAFIHHLTLLGAEYGYEPIANEHDGLVVIGEIPKEAVAVARERSGFRTAEIEPKPFWSGSDVGLPEAWRDQDCAEVAHSIQPSWPLGGSRVHVDTDLFSPFPIEAAPNALVASDSPRLVS